jgi:hypothetical protein
MSAVCVDREVTPRSTMTVTKSPLRVILPPTKS